MLTDFEMYVVRKHTAGVGFDYLVGDRVAQLWYDTPRGAALPAGVAGSRALSCDRSVATDWREMELLRDRVILPGSRVVECGCHQGLTTVLAAAWAGRGGWVHAFDAVLFNTLVARRNLALNGVTNAAVFCAAIGGERGLVNLYNESNSIAKREAWVNPDAAVMVRLEDVAARDADVLKLDIEGAELGVLEAGRERIAAFRRLAIEVHTDLLPGDGIARMAACLPGRALHVLWEDGRLEAFTGQPIAERVHLFAF